METMGPFVIIILLTQVVKYSASFEDCPMDCICYPDYLSNLASWKWVDKDIHLKPDDPEHEEFNPYTQHNEVYDNPNVAKMMREDPLNTVTCILRGDSSDGLKRIFTKIPSSTQVLSLLQAAGSGNITVGKDHFENLQSLIGVEIQGYVTTEDSTEKAGNALRLEADAFSHLHKLTYLNLENVVLHQRSLVNHIQEYTTKLVRITRVAANNSFDNEIDDEDDIMNELESQLMFISPNGKRDEGIIVPYNEYKQEAARLAKNHPTPIEPKIAVAFTNVPSLIHLRISSCNMQDMSWDMFYRLHNLKYLLLEKNNLLFLPDFAFYSTSNLTSLSLSGNRILSLQTVGLAGLLYLQKLDMTNNNITHLSELSLPPFPRLEVADFRFNPIETIFPSTFEVMNTTKTLYLGSPTVALTFFPNSFYGLVALTKLDIKNVRIGFLERPMLKGIPHLQHLTMDGNIRRISYDAFSEVPKLETLILKHCGIEKISMDAFYGLTSLIELDLSHNQLTFLPPGIFEDQISIQEIYLQHNKLTTVSKKLFVGVPAKLIRLEGNPWHCSCEMSTWNPYLVNQVKRFHIPKNTSSPLCQIEYDKGSMCNHEYTGFKVKYVYEKRVSPVCETPNKFNKRSIFEVIRKELRYCVTNVTTVTTPQLNPKKYGKGKISPLKYQGVILPKLKKKNIKSEAIKPAEYVIKEQENRLLGKSKLKQHNPTSISSVDIPKHIADEVNILSIIQTHLNLPPLTPTIETPEPETTTTTTQLPESDVTTSETRESLAKSIEMSEKSTMETPTEMEITTMASFSLDITSEEPRETTNTKDSTTEKITTVPHETEATIPAPTDGSMIVESEAELTTEITNMLAENPPTLTSLPTPIGREENEMSNQIPHKPATLDLTPAMLIGAQPKEKPKRQPKNLQHNRFASPISKKALKLAKLERMDMMLRRRS